MFSLVAILFLHYLGFLNSVVSFILVYSNNFIFFVDSQTKCKTILLPHGVRGREKEQY